MNETVNERINKLYLQSGEKSIRQYALKINLAPTTLNECIKGAEPRYSLLKAILDGNPSISSDWLMRGTGDMFRSVSNTPSAEIEALKAEINMLRGENRVLREQLGLPDRKETATLSA